MEPRPASASSSVLVHWMGVTDTNTSGNVHGGVVLKLCDEVAGIAALRHCGLRVVTAGLDRVTFAEPIEMNDVVTLSGAVNAVWRTSMEVGVRVMAENPRRGGGQRHTNTAYFTMVALDADGRPAAVPPLLCETPDELRRESAAQLRRRNRLTERDDLLRHRAETADR
jgi:acyl-CoA hydrolase